MTSGAHEVGGPFSGYAKWRPDVDPSELARNKAMTKLVIALQNNPEAIDAVEDLAVKDSLRELLALNEKENHA